MKEHVGRIVICLVLGVVIAIAVAWSIALYSPGKPPSQGQRYRVDLDLPPRVNRRWQWFVNHHAHLGHHLYIFRNGRIKDSDERGYVARELIHHSTLPPWVSRPTGHGGMYHETHAYGLPFLCLSRKNLNTSQRDFWLIRIGPHVGQRIVLPLRPLAFGFLTNTVCYAVLTWPISRLPGVLSRRRRQRRGRCPTCGYDLRGNLEHGCPECGWRRGDSPR